MDRHTHGPDGEFIPVDADVVEAATEAAAAAEVAETAADAEVEVAKIQAKRDVTIAETDLEREKLWQEGRVAELEGQVRGMREILNKLVPPEPEAPAEAAEPVVVEAPPAPPEETAPAPPAETPPEPEGKKRKGFWDAYR